MQGRPGRARMQAGDRADVDEITQPPTCSSFSKISPGVVDLCLRSFFFGPPYQKLLDLAAVYGLVHLLIQPADSLQRIQLFLLTLRQQFVPFIIPDVFLLQLLLRELLLP